MGHFVVLLAFIKFRCVKVHAQHVLANVIFPVGTYPVLSEISRVASSCFGVPLVGMAIAVIIAPHKMNTFTSSNSLDS